MRRADREPQARAAWPFAAVSILAAFVDQLPDGNGTAQRDSFAQPFHLGEPFFAGLGGRDGC